MPTENSKKNLLKVVLSFKDKTKVYACSRAKWALMVIISLIVVVSLSISLSITTPMLSKIKIIGGLVSSQDFINNVLGTSDEEHNEALWQYYTRNGKDSVVNRESIVKAILSIDSLEKELLMWRAYGENISQILNGKKKGIVYDSVLVKSVASLKSKEDVTIHLDSVLRKRVIENIEYKNNLNRRGEFQSMFRPIAGTIEKPFNRKTNTELQISINGVEPVYAISGGTVLFTTWSPTYGNMLQIQHGGGLVSLYSNMTRIMVDAGSVVGAGAIIGYVGIEQDVVKQDSVAIKVENKSFLRFSMWREGNPVDPELYMQF